MADAVQQSRFKLTSTSVPKTRLGLSLAERIKVIEAREMGKSMRQVVNKTLLLCFVTHVNYLPLFKCFSWLLNLDVAKLKFSTL